MANITDQDIKAFNKVAKHLITPANHMKDRGWSRQNATYHIKRAKDGRGDYKVLSVAGNDYFLV